MLTHPVLSSLPVLSAYHDPMSDVNTCLLYQQSLLAAVNPRAVSHLQAACSVQQRSRERMALL
jgi:hypothetical protein